MAKCPRRQRRCSSSLSPPHRTCEATASPLTSPLVPGVHAEATTGPAALFYWLYFVMTGLHALHLLVSFALALTVGSLRILELEVTDDGPGIPEALRSRLFVPFFTTKLHGTGIGLALSRQIAEAHGGTLTLQNRADTRGAEARLVIPITAPVVPPAVVGNHSRRSTPVESGSPPSPSTP